MCSTLLSSSTPIIKVTFILKLTYLLTYVYNYLIILKICLFLNYLFLGFYEHEDISPIDLFDRTYQNS